MQVAFIAALTANAYFGGPNPPNTNEIIPSFICYTVVVADERGDERVVGASTPRLRWIVRCWRWLAQRRITVLIPISRLIVVPSTL